MCIRDRTSIINYVDLLKKEPMQTEEMCIRDRFMPVSTFICALTRRPAGILSASDLA